METYKAALGNRPPPGLLDTTPTPDPRQADEEEVRDLLAPPEEK